MIICPRCGKDNQDHYKFCLGCGAEIVGIEPTPSVAGGDSPELGDEDIATAATTQLDEAEQGEKAPCPACGTMNPRGFTFCGNCGTRLRMPTGSSPPADATPGDRVYAHMSLIRPDGTEGGTHDVRVADGYLGRGGGSLFDGDSYLSPKHVRMTIEGDHISLEDCDSLNGVFVRLTSDERLYDGDVFRIGQELLRFDAIDEPLSTDDGTEVLGSPNPGYWGRLSLIVRRGVDGSAFPLMGDEMVLGRERGDILFSDDGYVSGTHAKLTLTEEGQVYLSDLGSSNGTFIRIREPRVVPFGTFVLMGQQLFRLETPQS